MAAWRHTIEWVKVPPLGSLPWKVLERGAQVPPHSLIITAPYSTAVLRFPVAAFKQRFVDLVDGGRVLGFLRAGDQIELQIDPDTLFPVRLPPDALRKRDDLTAQAARVDGGVVFTPGTPQLARAYAALTAHNPPFSSRSENGAAPPVLAAQPVHLKKGLGVRGKDLASLSADQLRKLYLDSIEGVYVDAVIPGSPAHSVGMQSHDVIRTFNRKPVRSAEDLLRAIESAPEDQPVEVEVVRAIIDSQSTRTFIYSVRLGEFTGNAHVVPSPNPTALPGEALLSPSPSSAPAR